MIETMKNVYPLSTSDNNQRHVTALNAMRVLPTSSPHNVPLSDPVSTLKVEMQYQALLGSMKGILKSLDDIERIRDINAIKSEVYRIKKSISLYVSSDQRWESFENHFDLVQSDFYKTVKKRYPSLTLVDLELCAYLRIELSTKEIARQLNLSVRGVETRKYRLKKKLQLLKDQDLNCFIGSL